ncbi:MAG: EF2563 family selenium-dependent molybdenum hydroxylase system protein [Deltaproteobacteria bacterium]|nr:EF2563 family selenium-dependent molybdenum hydroxylase system protein [Deltaproteobacteria bacterium]
MVVLIRGGGDLASGVAWRLYQSGFRVVITETQRPLAARRMVSFCEAVFEGRMTVEGVTAVLIPQASGAKAVWARGEIPVLVDPECRARNDINPDVMVDAIMAKRNLGTSMEDAPLVIALGPGFEAGMDAHFVVETNRGHYLGRLLSQGAAEPDTGIPGSVLGITKDRVIRAPATGTWKSDREIGQRVKKGDLIGEAGGRPVTAKIDGVLRGLMRPGVPVREGLKIGDIDPRGREEYCFSISEKALAVGGAVLEGILRRYSS